MIKTNIICLKFIDLKIDGFGVIWLPKSITIISQEVLFHFRYRQWTTPLKCFVFELPLLYGMLIWDKFTLRKAFFHSQWFNYSFQIGRPSEIHPCKKTDVFQVRDNEGAYCYHISNKMLDWHEAKRTCEALDPRAHLLRINDKKHMGFIEGVYNKTHSPGNSLIVRNKLCLQKLTIQMNFRECNTNI